MAKISKVSLKLEEYWQCFTAPRASNAAVSLPADSRERCTETSFMIRMLLDSFLSDCEFFQLYKNGNNDSLNAVQLSIIIEQ